MARQGQSHQCPVISGFGRNACACRRTPPPGREFVYGMPRAVAEAGLADEILRSTTCPPRSQGKRAMSTTRPSTPASPARPRSVAPDSTATARAPRASGVAGFVANLKADDFLALCELVRTLSGIDLSQYKRNQMERRVRTWTARRGTPDLTEYGQRTSTDPAELEGFLTASRSTSPICGATRTSSRSCAPRSSRSWPIAGD